MFLAEIFGPDLLIVVIVIAVVIFGGAAIPKLARSLGSAKTEFEKGIKTGASEADAKSSDAAKDAEAPKAE
ncbi:MAG: twin-arginine translocase TatA/TatE family subunit [Actinomycetes bacterium]